MMPSTVGRIDWSAVFRAYEEGTEITFTEIWPDDTPCDFIRAKVVELTRYDDDMTVAELAVGAERKPWILVRASHETDTPPTMSKRVENMRADPVGSTLRDVAEQLLDRRPVAVQLEPGDATRYDLLLVLGVDAHFQARNGILAVRFIGGDPAATTVVHQGDTFTVRPLSNGNAWTLELLDWWFGMLFHELNTIIGGK